MHVHCAIIFLKWLGDIVDLVCYHTITTNFVNSNLSYIFSFTKHYNWLCYTFTNLSDDKQLMDIEGDILSYFTSVWLFYITRHLTGLESHVTKQQNVVSTGNKYRGSPLRKSRDFLIQKVWKNQYEHTILTNMMKSKIFSLCCKNQFYYMYIWFEIMKTKKENLNHPPTR